LQGNQGADNLNGGEGNDVVYGGRDDDVIDVGPGVNFAQGNLGSDTVIATSSVDANTMLGGQGNDVIAGGGAADFLNGNLGSDSISAGGGSDILRGEDGDDTLDGGAGADIMDGGAGADRFVAASGSSSVTLEGADRISGWGSEDRIDVPGAGGPSAYYMIPTDYVGGGDGYGGGGPSLPVAISFAQALSQSNSWMRGHSDSIVTAQVQDGVAVFIDTNGDRAADLAIILVGTSIFEVSGTNFV
jgi:Ca2+-binding RTX toxin-like protein